MTINSMANNQLSTSMIRLSTGQRINSAADDAAGLAISERLNAQIRGLDRGTQNVMDMQNLINTAEGGLSTIGDNLLRMRELTLQSMNGILTDSDRQNIQFELDQIIAEIDATAQRTEFNGMRLLDGSFNREDGRGLHTAADAMGRGPMVHIGNMSAGMILGPQPFNVVEAFRHQTQEPPWHQLIPDESDPVYPPPVLGPDEDPNTGITPPAGITPPIGNLPPGTMVQGPMPSPQPASGELLSRIDEALTRVTRERSYLGAMSNRFDNTIASNQITNLNLAAANSRIRDADMALESMRLTQATILEQAQIAMQRREQERERERMPLLSLIS
jgi:flagellin